MENQILKNSGQFESNNNSVILLGSYGGDKTHALSAWCSTFKELGIKLPENIPDRIDIMFDYISSNKKRKYNELITGLANDGHGTPFEKSCLHFLVTSEIASHIHALKHRAGVSINSESARYKEMNEDKFYIPVDWQDEEKQLISEHSLDCFKKYHACVKRLVSQGYSRKRAKESARFYLPYSMQYTTDVMFNFRSFVHFQILRNSDHAQVEINQIAKMMLEQVKLMPNQEFKYSLEAFKL